MCVRKQTPFFRVGTSGLGLSGQVFALCGLSSDALFAVSSQMYCIDPLRIRTEPLFFSTICRTPPNIGWHSCTLLLSRHTPPPLLAPPRPPHGRVRCCSRPAEPRASRLLPENIAKVSQAQLKKARCIGIHIAYTQRVTGDR